MDDVQNVVSTFDATTGFKTESVIGSQPEPSEPVHVHPAVVADPAADPAVVAGTTSDSKKPVKKVHVKEKPEKEKKDKKDDDKKKKGDKVSKASKSKSSAKK